MPTLYVLRHAKSSWDDELLADHDRPLAPRGRRACERLRLHCGEAGVEPEVILCSTALRARETVAAVLPHRDDVSFEPSLYHAGAGEIVARVRRLEGDSAMIVGHNPGLEDAVLALAAPSPLRDRVAEKLPTGALVVLELARWDAVQGEIVSLVVPRELG